LVGKFSAGEMKLNFEGTISNALGVCVFLLNDRVVYVGMSIISLRRLG
jgi:hypothetical protein